MTLPKLLQETLRLADGGRVVCMLETPSGRVSGVIEQSFFDDFMGQPAAELSEVRRKRILSENLEFLEAEAARQLRMGYAAVVIR